MINNQINMSTDVFNQIKTLEFPDDIGLIHIKSVNDINIYICYNIIYSTIGDIIKTLYENYYYPKPEQVGIWSAEKKQKFEELDCKSTPKDKGFGKNFNLKLYDKINDNMSYEIKPNPYAEYLDDIYKKIGDSKDIIKIRTLSQREFEFNIVPELTISELKILITDKKNMMTPYDQQRLIFGGKQLEDHMTLSDYKIVNGVTVFIVLRLRGGMFTEYSSKFDLKPLKDCLLFVGVKKENLIKTKNLFINVSSR